MDALFAMLGSGVIKHLIPTKKINKFIPLLNVAVCTGFYMSQGHDFGTALGTGLTTGLMAVGGHQAVKTIAPGKIRINGQSI